MTTLIHTRCGFLRLFVSAVLMHVVFSLCRMSTPSPTTRMSDSNLFAFAMQWDRAPNTPGTISNAPITVIPMSTIMPDNSFAPTPNSASQSMNVSVCSPSTCGCPAGGASDCTSAGLCICGSVLMLIGGLDPKGNPSNDMYAAMYPPELDRSGKFAWKLIPPTGIRMAPRYENTCELVTLPTEGGSTSEMVLCFGGQDALQEFSSLWLFDPRSNIQSALGPPPLPQVTCFPAIPDLNQRFARTVDMCAAPDFNNMTDVNGCAWPSIRGLHSSIVIGEYWYIYGGSSYFQTVGDLWRLKLDSSIMAQAALQSTSTNGEYVFPSHTCPLSWELLTVPGGGSNFPGNSSNVAPSPRFATAVSSLGSRLYILGGTDGTDSSFEEVWMVDVASVQLSWTFINNIWPSNIPKPIPPPWRRLQAALFPLFNQWYNTTSQSLMNASSSMASGTRTGFVCFGGSYVPAMPAADARVWVALPCDSITPSVGKCNELASNLYWFPLTLIEGTNMLGVISAQSFAVMDDHQYLFGFGLNEEGPEKDMYRLDLTTGTGPRVDVLQQPTTPSYVTCASSTMDQAQFACGRTDLTPPAVWGAEAYVLGRTVYMWGGVNDTIFQSLDMWSYDVDRDVWQVMPAGSGSPSPSAKLPMAGFIGTNMFVFFGVENLIPIYRIYHYDIVQSTWSNLTLSVQSDTAWSYAVNGSDADANDLGGFVKQEADGNTFLYPQPRFYAKIVQRGSDELLMFGGSLSYNALKSCDLWSFNTTSMRWRLITAFNRTDDSFLPSRAQRCLSSHTLAIDESGDNLIVGFGLTSAGIATQLVWRYHFTTSEWVGVSFNEDASNSPSKRYDTQRAVIGNTLYVFSGVDDSPLEDLWKLDMDSWKWTRLDGDPSGSGSGSGAAASYLPAFATRPFGRTLGAMVGLPFTNAVFLFGGTNAHQLNDLHILFVDEYEVADHTIAGAVLAHDALRFISFDQNQVIYQSGSHLPVTSFPSLTSATISSLIAYSRAIDSGFIVISLINADCFSGTCINSSLSSNSSSMTRFSALRPITQPMRVQTSQRVAGGASAGSRLVIDCDQDRCFQVNTAFTASPVQFVGLEFRNGYSVEDGGVISIDNSTVSFDNCAFIGNTAGQRGGAISATSSNIRINQSEFRTNSAAFLGGAVYVFTGTVQIFDSLFDGNRIIQDQLVGFGLGGAVFLLATPLVAHNTHWSFNTANQGGAVMSASVLSVVPVVNPLDQQWRPAILPPTLNIQSCVFDHNQAKLQGGAVMLSSLFGDPSWYEVTIVNSTFNSNSASRDGGGMYLDGSMCHLINSTFSNNQCGGGGASVYSYITDTSLSSVVSPDSFSELNQLNNSAAYGPNFASLAISARIVDARAQNTYQESGSVIYPPLVVSLVDVYGSIIATDYSSYISITPTDSFAGTTTVQVQGGVANFSALVLNLPPGEAIQANFTSSLPLLSYDARNLSVTLTSSPCRPGQRNAGRFCQQCQAGSFSDQMMADNCTRCIEGTSQPNAGRSECLPCPPGSFASGSGTITCSVCPSGLYSWAAGSSTCVPCNAGLECGNGKASSLSGRYVLPIPLNASQDFNPVSITCPFGNCLSNFTCSHDRLPYATNPLCSACAPGFNNIEHECVECPSIQWLKLIGIAILFLVCTLLMHILAQNTSSASLLQILLYWTQISQLLTGSSASGWLAWLHIFQLSPAKSTGSTCVVPLDSYGTLAFELCSPLIFTTALFTLAGMSSLWRNCSLFQRCRDQIGRDTVYRDDHKDGDVSNRSTSANNDQRKDMGGEHGIGSADESTVPASSTSASMGVRPSHPWLDRVVRRLHSIRIPFDSLSRSRTLLSIFLFTYNSVSESVFSHLTCVDLGDSLPRVVYLDGTMDCSSSTYKGWLTVCIIVLITFVIGIPVALAFKLKRMHSTLSAASLSSIDAIGISAGAGASNPKFADSQSHRPGSDIPLQVFTSDSSESNPPHSINSISAHLRDPSLTPSDSFASSNSFAPGSVGLPELSSSSSTLPAHVAPFAASPYRLLFEAYGPHSYLWQLVILVRRAVYVCVNAALAATPDARFFSFTLLSTLFFSLHMLVQPYRTETDNRAESVSLVLCIVISSVMMFAQSQSRNDSNGTIDSFPIATRVSLFLLMMLPTIAFSAMLFRTYWKRRKAAKQSRMQTGE